MKKLLCAALGSAAAFTGGSLGLASYILRIPRQSLEQALDWQRDHYDISWLETTPQEPYTVTSWDGYILHAVVLRPTVESRRYVILSHARKKLCSFQYWNVFLHKSLISVVKTTELL